MNVYQVNVTNESGSSATFYYTRVAYRGDKNNPNAAPEDVTFDPAEDGQEFLGLIRSRWDGTDNVLEVTSFSRNRDDKYDSYRGLAAFRSCVKRALIQLHVLGASDGCLLAVGKGQLLCTYENQTIDYTNLAVKSGDTQMNFMNKLKEMRNEDAKCGGSREIIIKFDQLKKDGEEENDDEIKD